MKEFGGKTAVITGSGSGIGRGMAVVLARQGVRIVVSDIEEAAAAATVAAIEAAGGTALAVRTDVASLESVQALAQAARDAFGDVHILCNNAGVSQRRRGTDATHEDWVWMVGVNLWGVIHGIETFLPDMLSSGQECHIVNTSSMNGIFPSGFSAMYSTTKYGILGLTDTLRNELQGTAVGISALCPAGVLTRIMESERNRPASLTPSTPPPPHTPSSKFNLSPAREPEEVGDMVLQGIIQNQLYIFTDMNVRPHIEDHHQRMMEEFDRLAEWESRQGGAQATA